MRTRLALLASSAGLGALVALVTSSTRAEDPGSEAGPAVQGADPRPLAARDRPSGWPRSPAPRRLSTRAPSGETPSPDVVATTDPTSDAYDPVKLFLALQRPPTEILADEPRDPDFAPRREASLTDRLSARLRKRLSFPVKTETHCGTSSCEVRLQVPEGSPDLVNTVLENIDLQTLVEVGQVGPDPPNGLRITILYPPELRDEEIYGERLRRHEAMDDAPSPSAP
jgi:hypothetical protein